MIRLYLSSPFQQYINSPKVIAHSPSSTVVMAMSEMILPDAEPIKSVSVSQTKPDKVPCTFSNVGHDSMMFVCKGCVLFGFVGRAT